MSRLLATFATPEMEKPDFPLRTGLIPAGYVDGAFVARVQVAVPPMPIVGATWDLGASVVSRGRVREDASGRVRLGTPGAPVVFEKEMRFGSGPYEVVAVAHEDVSDQVASARLEGSFPDLGAVEAALGPIAVTQTARGAFLRNGETRTSGFVLAGNGDSVQPDRPTAIVGLVCRGEDRKAPLVVERFLMGEDATPVGATEPDLRSEPCAQWLDVIPEGTLGAGTYTYVVRVTGPEGEI